MRPPGDVQADLTSATEFPKGAVGEVADEVSLTQGNAKAPAPDAEVRTGQLHRGLGNHLRHPFFAELAAVAEERDLDILFDIDRLEEFGIGSVVERVDVPCAQLFKVRDDASRVREECVELRKVGVYVVVELEPSAGCVLREDRGHVAVVVCDRDAILLPDPGWDALDVVDRDIHDEDGIDTLLLGEDLEDMLLPPSPDMILCEQVQYAAGLLVIVRERSAPLLTVEETVVKFTLLATGVGIRSPPG